MADAIPVTANQTKQPATKKAQKEEVNKEEVKNEVKVDGVTTKIDEATGQLFVKNMNGDWQRANIG